MVALLERAGEWERDKLGYRKGERKKRRWKLIIRHYQNKMQERIYSFCFCKFAKVIKSSKCSCQLLGYSTTSAPDSSSSLQNLLAVRDLSKLFR